MQIEGADSLSLGDSPEKARHELGPSQGKQGNAASISTDFPVAIFMHDLSSQSRETPHGDLEGLFASLFGLSNVTVAFGKTVGPWHPDWQNHRAAEEKNIYVEPTSHLFDEYLTSPPLLPTLHIVSSDTRDEILAMILKNCAKDNITKVASAFPSAEMMSWLLLRFLESHASEEDSWIHFSTFDANKVPLELLMACVASSAMKSTTRAIQKFGKALHSIIHPYLFQVVSFPCYLFSCLLFPYQELMDVALPISLKTILYVHANYNTFRLSHFLFRLGYGVETGV